MKWFVVIIFNTTPGDIFIFHEPVFESREECLVTLWESKEAVKQKLLQEYGEPMPVEAVSCLTEEVIKKVLKNEMVDSVNHS